MIPPQNLEAEVSVLGAVLLGEKMLDRILGEVELAAGDFYRDRHRLIFAAMLALKDRPEPIDVLTVCAELRRRGELDGAGGEPYVHSLPSLVPTAGNAPHYARLVAEAAALRGKLERVRDLTDAVERGDWDAISTAEGRLLADRPHAENRRPSREDRQAAVFAHVEGGGGTVWRTPFNELNDLLAGGLRPGQFVLLGAHGAHGKSVLVTQLLDHAARQDARCCLYSNEMTADEIDLRFVARESNIGFHRLLQGKLRKDDAAEHQRFVKAVERIGEGYEVVNAAGMTADELARDIRRERWDYAAIDLLNGVAGGRETKDIDHNISTLAACSRQAGCVIVACNHLNQARSVGRAYPPEPSQADIRGSGQLYDLSNVVLLLYRYESDIAEGEKGDQSSLRVAKARGAREGRIDLSFNGSRMRFLTQMEPGTVTDGMAAA